MKYYLLTVSNGYKQGKYCTYGFSWYEILKNIRYTYDKHTVIVWSQELNKLEYETLTNAMNHDLI